MYYLESRYYDPELGRFINGDAFASTGQGVLGNNMFAYCLNNPVCCVDRTGCIVGAATVTVFGISNTWNPVGWVVLGVIGIVACVTIAYDLARSTPRTTSKTKILADVKAKQQTEKKQYQLAYVSSSGGLVKVGKKLSFTEALTALGISGAVNSVTNRYSYNIGKSSEAQRALEHLGSGNWGIYTSSQTAAKALAVVFGFSGPPEVHGSGMYGHYHGGYWNSKTSNYEHVFHIWFGGVKNY